MSSLAKMKIRRIGSSLGVILPKELLARLNLGEGDILFATDNGRGLEIAPYDPEVERQLEIAERVMREDRDVLRKLAK
jgi:putative addiction module antidote